MLGGRGRSQRRDREIDAVARQRDNIHVTLDHDQVLDVPQRLPRFVQPVEFPALVKQYGLRRVQVFGLAIAESSAAESDRPAPRITDRKHDPVPETVVVLAIVLADDEAGRQQAFRGFGGLAVLVEQVAPALGGVADAEALGRCAVDTSLLEVVDGGRMIAQATLPVGFDGLHE